MSVPHFDSTQATVWHGDCLDVMRDLPDASIDAVVTDPPYGLEFMGREWDGADGFRRSLNEADTGRESVFGRTSRTSPEYRAGHLFQTWCEQWAAECLRLLKPGGHLLAFGGTRTFHRLAAGIEDAGFEIRDSIAWLYGSGFPKSLDVARAVDAHQKHGGSSSVQKRRAAMGDEYIESDVKGLFRTGAPGGNSLNSPASRAPAQVGDRTTDAARWQGWGTALKPAFEPIVVARKPLDSTVAANVLAHGTGALHIDVCRIGDGIRGGSAAGRWPANVVLDESQAMALDQQAPNTGGRGRASGPSLRAALETTAANGSRRGWDGEPAFYGDCGGASRFFYTAKAATSERPSADGVGHPTVKPLALMLWLVRLVTPPGGKVLEPFAGSGTTVEACVREGFHCTAIERETDYLTLIVKRLDKPHPVGLDFDWEDAS